MDISYKNSDTENLFIRTVGKACLVQDAFFDMYYIKEQQQHLL